MTIIRVARHDESMVVRPLTATDVLEELPTGAYSATSTINADMPTSSGVLLHLRRSSSSLIELWLPWTIDGRVYKRVYSSGAWRDWLIVGN